MSYRLRVLLLLTCAFVAGLGSLGLTIQAARENRSGSPPPSSLSDGLVAVNNPLDLGDVPQDILDGTFELVNKSKKPVRMVRIAKSCRCTEMEATDEEIASGGTAKISFKWDTTGVRGVKGSSFTVLYSKEGEEGLYSFPLSVRGNIVPFFDLVPDRLEFTAGKPETKTIKLVPRKDDSNVIIQQVTCNFPALKINKISDQEVVVCLDMNESCLVDEGIRREIIFHTNLPQYPSESVPVSIKLSK